MSTASPAHSGDWAPLAADAPPVFLKVGRRRRETADAVTFDLAVPDTHTEFRFAPGQFNMLYAFGVGEVPVSLSGDPATPRRIAHTVRAVGPVSRALCEVKPGASLGVRGPFGTPWPIDAAIGHDVLLLAGGLGLAPLRPALYHLLAHRHRYGRVALVYGARSPEDLLFSRELEGWRRMPGLQLRVTVDSADPRWAGDIGLVTKLLPKVRFDPTDVVVMMCGPEVMMRFAVGALASVGVPGEQIWLSIERNMKCAAGTCGHCQFGPYFVCKDGPVFRYDAIERWLALREV
jgi:NAD(P)H-flavin reductase